MSDYHDKIQAIRERLQQRFPDREVQYHGTAGPMGPAIFTATRPGRPEQHIRLPWERFEDYGSAEEILPDQVLRAFELHGSLLLKNDNTIELEGEDPSG